MGDTNKIKIRRLACLAVVALVVGAVTLVLRGPYVSNALKKLILPELEMMSGQRVIARKIYVNPFPLFVGASDVKVFDDGGNRIVVVPRAKAYIDLSGIFNRNIAIRRLVIKEPEVASERRQTEEIIEHVKAYLSKERESAVKVKIRAVEIQRGSVDFRDDAQKASARLKGLSGEIIIGEAERIRAAARNIIVAKEGWPTVSADADVSLLLKGGTLQIKRLVVGSFGSKVSGSGSYADGNGSLRTNIDLLFSTVKKIFNLANDGTGRVSASGLVSYLNRKISLELKLEGDFYIQTLLEFLKAKEPVSGLVAVTGEVKGPLENLRGKGRLKVKGGSFYGVDVDSLKCNVAYAGGRMRFTDGVGRLYNGSADVAVAIALPVVNYYSVDVGFRDIDSAPVFKLIGWDPGVEKGKVTGTLSTAGAAFNPSGKFEYRSVQTGKDILGRMKEIAGGYRLEGGLLSLSDLRLGSDRTEVRGGGTVDLGRKTLALNASMRTSDVADLSMPYYEKLKGGGEFDGHVTGSFEDPVVDGKIRMTRPVISGYEADSVAGDITYRKALMTIRSLAVRGKEETLDLDGSISFRDARTLFDLTGAEYHLRASVIDADMGKLVKIFYPEFTGSGKLRSELSITGRADNPDIGGAVNVAGGSIYDVAFDSASLTMNYAARRLGLSNVRLVKGKSVVSGDAWLHDGGGFSFSAASKRILLSDLVPREINGNAVFSLKAEGSGTLDNPSVTVNGKVVEGVLRGRNIGSGGISASIRQKDISVRASLINDSVLVTGKGRLEKDIPWDGRIEIRNGRYDAVISAFLKDIPEDLILSADGTVLLHGNRNHVAASAAIRQVMLSMYGYSFSSDKEIRMELNDRKLVFDRISMHSGDASLSVDGNLVIGKQYDLSFEGRSSLSPFKSLSNKIALLKGDAQFVLSVTGGWDNPKINGGVTLLNGALGVKDLPYRINSVGGYVYMDNDRIVLQALSGKTGGGDIDMSGVVYLKKFAVKRFYIDARLNDITTSFSNEFSANFGGDLMLKGTPAERTVSGDIKINRARYRERVEWKSWLLQAKKAGRFKGEISDLERTGLNIRVTGQDNIRVDNNIARAAVNVDLIVRGTIYRPVLVGRVETDEGTVFFRNNEFRILHAYADFSDPNRINPFVMISADTVVQGYKITLNLQGQFDHFDMSLSSDPVLEEMDVLSLLTVGQTGTEMKGLEGSIGASEATGFVTGKIQDVLEERMKTITGLDRFQIDPHVSRITGTVEPQVTVSKRLMGDKMFVTYATAVGAKEEQIVKLEYFLTKKVSLVGIRDERGIVGGDLMFRFRFK